MRGGRKEGPLSVVWWLWRNRTVSCGSWRVLTQWERRKCAGGAGGQGRWVVLGAGASEARAPGWSAAPSVPRV